jgi:hypothetical protein
MPRLTVAQIDRYVTARGVSRPIFWRAAARETGGKKTSLDKHTVDSLLIVFDPDIAHERYLLDSTPKKRAKRKKRKTMPKKRAKRRHAKKTSTKKRARTRKSPRRSRKKMPAALLAYFKKKRKAPKRRAKRKTVKKKRHGRHHKAIHARRLGLGL